MHINTIVTFLITSSTPQTNGFFHLKKKATATEEELNGFIRIGTVWTLK